MNNGYQDQAAAAGYLAFLDSANGQVQKDTLSKAILKSLAAFKPTSILDAGCGPGWLCGTLGLVYRHVFGCDSSPHFVDYAKHHFPEIDFQTADLTGPLPYPSETFDTVILNMAAPDISDLDAMYKNLFAVAKPGGRLIVTIPNPYYTFPAAVWKRSITDLALGRKPTLRLTGNYATQSGIVRQFNPAGEDNILISSNAYTLADYINKARAAQFVHARIEELGSRQDSLNFDLQYQLYRYPLLLLLEFVKPGLRD